MHLCETHEMKERRRVEHLNVFFCYQDRTLAVAVKNKWAKHRFNRNKDREREKYSAKWHQRHRNIENYEERKHEIKTRKCDIIISINNNKNVIISLISEHTKLTLILLLIHTFSAWISTHSSEPLVIAAHPIGL